MENAGSSRKSDAAGANADAAARPPVIRDDSGETERPTSAQPRGNAATSEQLTADEKQEPGEEVDPADKIEDFDWEELHERYHQAIDTASQEEAALMQEWKQLMDVGRLWAHT
jgi:hypothetical protein